MIIQNWPNLSLPVKGTFLTFCAGVAIGGGLTLSAYSLAFGLNLSVEMPRDIFLWPKVAMAGYTGANTLKWIKIAGIIGLTPALSMAGAFLVNLPKGNIHGDARFASKRDIKKMKLRSERGILAGFTGPLPTRNYGKPVNRLGFEVEEGGTIKVERNGRLTQKNLLSYGGDEHLFLYAPTRSGKGVGVVVPNLLNWSGSTVVLDIKKENWMLTAGFRKSRGQAVFLFDPLEPNGHTHCWNPLSTVRRRTEHQTDDLQRLANLFFPRQSKDPFFDLAAQAAFVGVAGYLAESTQYPFTLGEIYRQLTLPEDVTGFFKERIEFRNKAGNPLSV